MTNVTPPGGPLPFPPGFTWGAATAAYQIEGATDADGRGPSVWDTFSRIPGKVRGGDTGDTACDSYHRYPEDADLLRSLGLSAYRFSISWPRIFPEGGGQLNQAGLDYYKAVLDALGERGITAAATLFHWDLPQALQDRGGWASRETALRFADYAGVVAEALGDRITRWITLNEPLVVAHNGHRIGVHAPGLTDNAVAAAVTHHLLLGHGLATGAVRAAVPGAEVGITLNLTPVRVAPDVNGTEVSRGDDPPYPPGEAVERARLVADAIHNGVFLEPVLFGRYPAHAPAAILPPADLIREGDMETIAAPIDFLGVNYYQPEHLRAGNPDNLRRGEDRPLPGIGGGVVHYTPDGMERTPMGWLIDPDGLYELLLRLSADAPGLPLYITENGCAAEDYINPDGEVNDLERIKFLHLHLAAAARAARDGASLAGYYVWSLLDNFEWAYGYQKRFGIVYVDFATQQRIPKASSAFFARVASENAIPPLPASWPV
jgi:beta-glucosidase